MAGSNCCSVAVCVFSLLAVAAVSHELLVGNTCTDVCDGNVTLLNPRPFCGTDGHTYNTTQEAFRNEFCYSYCNVAVRYAGLCGCPNNCGAHLGHGTCERQNHSSSVECRCNNGWSGPDCMTIKCSSGNNCSGNGLCRTTASGQDYCACFDGFTGGYCAQEVFRYPLWDAVVPNVPPLLQPGYQFVTPLFNLSVMGELRVRIDEEDLAYLVNPYTVYNNSRQSKPVTVFFNNGNDLVENVVGTMQVKGATSRLDMKKGWRIKFPESQPFVGGVTNIGLKTGNQGGDSLMKPFLMSSLGRGVGILLPRPSMTTLYINDVFMGLYFFDEAPDDDEFLNTAFGSHDGPIAKLTYAAYLTYNGPNVSSYDSAGEHIFGNGVLLYVETDDWTSYIGFVRNLTLPSFQPEEAVDVDALLRQSALEAYAVDDDHFLAGNNYFLYRRTTDLKWVVINHDFDTELAPKHGAPVPQNVLEYPFDTALNGNNPLVKIVFSTQAYMDRYTQVLQLLSAAPMLGPVGSSTAGHLVAAKDDDGASFGEETPVVVESLPSAYLRLSQFVYPWVEADLLQQVAFTTNPLLFNQSVNSTVALITTRALAVAAQLATAAAASNGKLSSGEIAAIAAGGGAGLVAIIVFVKFFVLRAARRHSVRGYYAQVEEQSRYLD